MFANVATATCTNSDCNKLQQQQANNSCCMVSIAVYMEFVLFLLQLFCCFVFAAPPLRTCLSLVAGCWLPAGYHHPFALVVGGSYRIRSLFAYNAPIIVVVIIILIFIWSVEFFMV